MKTYTLECDNCGASLKIKARQQIYKCEYCDSVVQMPKALFDELKQVDRFVQEKEERKKNDERDAEGEKVYKSDKRIWKITLIVWLIAICGLFAADESVPQYHEWIKNYWPSLLIFGGSYMISAKPRMPIYLKFQNEASQRKIYKWITLWRGLFLIWALVMSVCWGIPNDAAIHKPMFDTGFALLIAGMVFFIRFRPTKYRYKHEVY